MPSLSHHYSVGQVGQKIDYFYATILQTTTYTTNMVCCSAKCKGFSLITFISLWSAATLVCLIAYSRYELNNDIILEPAYHDSYNNGLPTVIMNVFNLASLLFAIRLVLQLMYAPSADQDFLFVIGWCVGCGQIATLVCALVSFGYHCSYGSACYTITSPLYFLVVFWLHLVFFAVAVCILVILWALFSQLWWICRCDDLRQQQPTTQTQARYTAIIEEKPPVVVVTGDTFLTFDSVNQLHTRQKDTKCSICHTDYTGKDTVEVLKGCSHYFHKECIGAWKKKKADSTCPVCRITIVTVK